MRGAFILTATLILIFGVAVPEFLAASTPGYDSTSQFLSELGAVGAEGAMWTNFAGFLPVGVLWFAATIQLYRHSPKGAASAVGALLLLGTAASYAGAAFFPCDPGCPIEGSAAQAMHNLLGLIGYLTVPPALLALGLHYAGRGHPGLGVAALAVAAIFSSAFFFMTSADASPMRGLWQRVGDYSLFAWMFLASIALPWPARGAA